MTRIVICRHGNTFDKGEIVTRVGARTDLPLSSSGRAQVKALASGLSKFTFSHAYCSPLIRTQQTATAIITADIPLETLEFLTEIDYGEDENKPESEVVARLGQDMLDLWDLEAIVPDGWKVNPEAIIHAWEQFFESQRHQEGDILVVTSNGIARFILDVISNPDINTPRKLRTAAYGVISLNGDRTDLLVWDKRAD